MLFQVLFLAIYDLLLSKETFFNTNRGYLLSTPILSLMIPLIQITPFQKVVSQEFINQLPEVVLSPETVIQQTAWYQSSQYFEVLFWTGVVIFICFFSGQVIKVTPFNYHFYYRKEEKLYAGFCKESEDCLLFFQLCIFRKRDF
jgi:hypothetical protein